MDHHALLLVGDRESLFSRLRETHPAGADIEHLVLDTLTVGVVRTLQERVALKPLVRKKRCFILSCGDIAHEAQHALLKLLEDPPQTAEFILVAPSREMLLPTLRSRLQEEEVRAISQDVSEATTFLESLPQERIRMIERELKHKETARGWAERLILNLASLDREKSVSSLELRELSHATAYITRKGSSPKMILEHLALTLSRR